MKNNGIIVNKEISCYSTSLALKYARKKSCQEKVLEGIDVLPEILNNPQEWTDAFFFAYYHI